MDSPRETHAGTLTIGNLQIPCAVLSDGTRVISATGLYDAFGQERRGAVGEDGRAKLPRFLARKSFIPFISKDFGGVAKLLRYTPKQGGREGLGYPATILVDICGIILDADQAGVLRSMQQPLVAAARVLLRAFARVGVTALVDEATGYLPETKLYADQLKADLVLPAERPAEPQTVRVRTQGKANPTHVDYSTLPRCPLGRGGWAEVPTPSQEDGEAFVRVVARMLVEWARADVAAEDAAGRR